MTILVTLENPERTGAPRMALQYGGALVEAGHRVLAACGPPARGTSSILPELDAAGLEVRRVPSFTPRSAVGALGRVRAVIRDEGVDCVIGFQRRDHLLACLGAGLTGARCVISGQNRHVFRGGPLGRRVKSGIYGWALRRWADRVVCTSEPVVEEVQGDFGIEAGRTRVLPNGIDMTSFPTYGEDEARATRRQLGVPEEAQLLLNVGRIDSQKGQDLLLRAFRRVAGRAPRPRLVLVGAVGRSSTPDEDRAYEDELHALVEAGELEDRVQFLGWRDDVPRLLAAADLYVHSARWEGPPLCLAVLEAMAARLPVISTDCAGRPDGFVDGEHGWIVPAGDVDALEAALERALSEGAGGLDAMGLQARALAERRYEIRRIGAEFVQVVEEVMDS